MTARRKAQRLNTWRLMRLAAAATLIAWAAKLTPKVPGSFATAIILTKLADAAKQMRDLAHKLTEANGVSKN